MLSLLVAISLAAEWTGSQSSEPDQAQPAPELGVDVQPYSAPQPQPDLEALVFLGANPRTRHACTVTAVIDAFGEVLDAIPTECPRELRNSSRDAVRAWGFHPPMQGEKAVKGRYEVTFLFVANSVEVPEAKGRKKRLVRTQPVAVPRWPQPPKTKGEIADWLEEQGRRQARCVIDFTVDKRNAPQDFELVDCPEVLAEPLMRRLKRYGIDVRGAEPGDGKIYRIEWVYRL